MTKINLIKSVVALAILLIANSLIAKERIDLERFDKIIATGAVEVILEKGDREEAILTTRNYEERDVKITVNEGVLKINVLKSLVKSGTSIQVEVTYKQLRAIKVQAGAEISTRNVITGDYLELKARSGSEMELDVEVNDLLAIASEGGKINLSGNSESQEIKAISGGEIHAYNLKSDYAYVTSNAGGLAEVIAKERIEANASTGGRINYKGNPNKTKIKDFLGGTVREM